MYYYFYNSIRCKCFIQNLLDTNKKTLYTVQDNIRNDKHVEQIVQDSLDFNIKQIKYNPCITTFNQHDIKDFFHFYNKLFENHSEQFKNKLNKTNYDVYDILSTIDRFNYHLQDISTKLK